jgi:hypothetical protein
MKAAERVSCPKCTFAPNHSKAWKLEYKEQCYGAKTCGWEDNEIKEHLHKICPDCGYMFACESFDYDKLKRGTDAWTTNGVATPTVKPIEALGANTRPGHGGMGNVKPELQAAVSACSAHRTPVVLAPVVRPAVSTRQPVTVYTPPAVTTPVKCRTCPVTADGKPVVK